MGSGAQDRFDCFKSLAIRTALKAFDAAMVELEKENKELKLELSKLESLRSAIKEITP